MSTVHTCDTVIIGAGLAGIAAARTLRDDYVVLEADKKIGGRVQSEIIKTPEGKNVIINPGAQWLHRDVRVNTPENPLLAYAQSSELIRDTMPREFWRHGSQDTYVGKMKLIQSARTLIDNHTGPDTDLHTLFNPLGSNESVLSTTFGEVETGAPLREVSAEDVRELVACNKGDFTRKGLGKFVENYAADVMPNIRLNNPVSLIRWNSGPNKGVEIHTKNGDIYRAKRCIITVSVGVLKSGDIRFEPELPQAYKEQLSHINMGNFNKVFLVFKPGFKFPVNHNTHLDVRTEDGQDIFYLARDNGQPLVTTFLGGELARLCDRDPAGATKMAIDGLCEIWGDHVRQNIADTRVTRWGNNDLVQGGYSRVDIGHHAVRQTLAEPIADTLYLAGEAIGAKHPESGRNWATHMAGAVLSGERAAKLILREREKERAALIGKYGGGQSTASASVSP